MCMYEMTNDEIELMILSFKKVWKNLNLLSKMKYCQICLQPDTAFGVILQRVFALGVIIILIQI